MAIEQADTSLCQDSAWLRNQRVRIEQRHLQFGQHCRLDIGSLLMRVAQRRQLATLAEVGRSEKARQPIPIATEPVGAPGALQHITAQARHVAQLRARRQL